MADLLDLYDLAEIHNIGVYWFDLGAAESLSLQMEDGSCAIAMDPWRLPTVADETVKLAHELGHFDLDSELQLVFSSLGTVIFEFTGASNVKEIAQLIAANSF